MTARADTTTLRLICRSLPDLPEAVAIGLQDKQQAVHAGKAGPDGAWRFQCSVAVKGSDAADPPAFSGPFVHGTPGARFLYLSWKRADGGAAPWVQRVKIPLSGISWELVQSGQVLEADITGRKPHASETIAWTAGRR
jgi:hypothetical protein